MAKGKTAPVDPNARITERILADLEAGVRPWLKLWSVGRLSERVTRPLRATAEPYRGINVVLLLMEAVACGYASSTWLTYRQAQALGGRSARARKARLLSIMALATRPTPTSRAVKNAKTASAS